MINYLLSFDSIRLAFCCYCCTKYKPTGVNCSGYEYTYKRTRGSKDDWRCSVRNKTVQCRATVIQEGVTFRRGPTPHINAGNVCALKKAKVVAKVKQCALQRLFEPVQVLAEEALSEQHREQGMNPGLKVDNLARQANRFREGHKPRHTRTL